MTPAQIEAERDNFEAFATRMELDVSRWGLAEQRYANRNTSHLWEGWLAAKEQAQADARAQLIETAPKDKEVLVWREDSGWFIAKLTTPDVVITPEEMERENLEFPDDFEEWYCDAYGWQQGTEAPTHWLPLPGDPIDSVMPAPSPQ